MAKNVKMRKRGSRDCDVHADSVEAFEASGWQRVDGAAPVAEEDTDTGLSKAEKKREVEAAGSVARKAGAKDGLKGKELEAFVESAKTAAAEALEK